MKKKYKINLIIFLVGIVLAVLSFFLDKQMFLFVDFIQNPYLDYAFGAITHFGSVIIVMIIMTTLFMWGERKKEWIPVLWLAFITSSLLCVGIKYLVGRSRPFDVVVLSFFGVLNYSFPSLHATASFTAVEVLDREFPKFKWFWVVFAFIVAFSRVYLKVHYLSDVIAGALLGYVVGFSFIYLEENFKIFKRLKWSIFQKKK